MKNYDVYLILCETAHGKRFWRTDTDNALNAVRLQAFGPATVGPAGYLSEEMAAEAIADLEMINLYDPENWDLDNRN